MKTDRYDIALLLRIKTEVMDELSSLDRLRVELEALNPLTGEDNLIHIRGVALTLHDFYNGIEKIFRYIAKELNGGIPKGEDWHNELLYQMSVTIDGLRPAVISKDLYRDLKEYLGFRHIVRHIYGYELNYKKINLLLENFPLVWKIFSEEIRKFILFIEEIIERSSS